MRSPLELLIALLAALRLRFRRYQARRLLKRQLPRGLQEPPALPPPPAPPSSEAEYRGLLFSAQALRSPQQVAPLLLRLSALLPPPAPLSVIRLRRLPEIALAASLAESISRPSLRIAVLRVPGERRPLSVLRLSAFRLDRPAEPPPGPPALLEPVRIALRPEPAPLELAVARPELLGLDSQGLPPAARDQPALACDRPSPPAPGRALEPRTPLPRAPLSYLDPRAYRLDAKTLEAANETALLPVHDGTQFWVHPGLYSEIVDVRYLESVFLWPSPTAAEWFAWWQDTMRDRDAPGGREALAFPEPEYLWYQMQQCKEQMLIRRDVAKDESPPKAADFAAQEWGPAVPPKEWEVTLAELVGEKEWIPSTVQTFKELGVSPLPGRPAADAYFEWRSLVKALDD